MQPVRHSSLVSIRAKQYRTKPTVPCWWKRDSPSLRDCQRPPSLALPTSTSIASLHSSDDCALPPASLTGGTLAFSCDDQTINRNRSPWMHLPPSKTRASTAHKLQSLSHPDYETEPTCAFQRQRVVIKQSRKLRSDRSLPVPLTTVWLASAKQNKNIALLAPVSVQRLQQTIS